MTIVTINSWCSSNVYTINTINLHYQPVPTWCAPKHIYIKSTHPQKGWMVMDFKQFTVFAYENFLNKLTSFKCVHYMQMSLDLSVVGSPIYSCKMQALFSRETHLYICIKYVLITKGDRVVGGVGGHVPNVHAPAPDPATAPAPAPAPALPMPVPLHLALVK